MDQTTLAFEQICWLLDKTPETLRADIERCIRASNDLYHFRDDASCRRYDELVVELESLRAGLRLLERADFVEQLKEFGRFLQPNSGVKADRSLEDAVARECWQKVNALGLAILLGHKSKI